MIGVLEDDVGTGSKMTLKKSSFCSTCDLWSPWAAQNCLQVTMRFCCSPPFRPVCRWGR